MNTTEKIGVILAVVLVIAGIFYYGLPNTGRGSAAGTFLSPSSLSCDIYISSSSAASDANNGLTISTPVRTIRRSFALANNCKTANIKFLGDAYEVLGSDLDQGIPTNPPIVIGDYVETINVSPGQSGGVRIYGLPEVLLKGDTIVIEDSTNVNAKCNLTILKFIFEKISLSPWTRHNVNLTIDSNTFIDPTPPQQASLDIVGSTTTNVTNNIFKIELQANIGLKLALYSLVNPNTALVSANTFVFGNESAYDHSQDQEAMGIYIPSLSGTNTYIDIINNHFSTPDAVFQGNDINPRLFGIATTGNQSNLKIQNNYFDHFYGINVALRDFLDPSENIIQKVDISDNYQGNY